jgi:hypothetical protein
MEEGGLRVGGWWDTFYGNWHDHSQAKSLFSEPNYYLFMLSFVDFFYHRNRILKRENQLCSLYFHTIQSLIHRIRKK